MNPTILAPLFGLCIFCVFSPTSAGNRIRFVRLPLRESAAQHYSFISTSGGGTDGRTACYTTQNTNRPNDPVRTLPAAVKTIPKISSHFFLPVIHRRIIRISLTRGTHQPAKGTVHKLVQEKRFSVCVWWGGMQAQKITNNNVVLLQKNSMLLTQSDGGGNGFEI